MSSKKKKKEQGKKEVKGKKEEKGRNEKETPEITTRNTQGHSLAWVGKRDWF